MTAITIYHNPACGTDMLPDPQKGGFTEEDGEQVTDEHGNRISR